MPAVEVPSRNSATVSLAPRPKRRWIAMNITVPTGRAMKASEKITKEYSVPFSAVREGEEHRREDQHRGDAVDEEVEEFRRAPDDHADGDVAGRDVRGLRRLRRRASLRGASCGGDPCWSGTDAGRRRLQAAAWSAVTMTQVALTRALRP